MELIKDFLLEYYIWILVVLVIMLITVVGFLADTKKKRKQREKLKEEQTTTNESNQEKPLNDMNMSQRVNSYNIAPDFRNNMQNMNQQAINEPINGNGFNNNNFVNPVQNNLNEMPTGNNNTFFNQTVQEPNPVPEVVIPTPIQEQKIMPNNNMPTGWGQLAPQNIGVQNVQPSAMSGQNVIPNINVMPEQPKVNIGVESVPLTQNVNNAQSVGNIPVNTQVNNTVPEINKIRTDVAPAMPNLAANQAPVNQTPINQVPVNQASINSAMPGQNIQTIPQQPTPQMINPNNTVQQNMGMEPNQAQINAQNQNFINGGSNFVVGNPNQTVNTPNNGNWNA